MPYHFCFEKFEVFVHATNTDADVNYILITFKRWDL